MPGTPYLVAALIAGLGVMALFAFTSVGLLGEAVAALAILALVTKAALGAGRAMKRHISR